MRSRQPDLPAQLERAGAPSGSDIRVPSRVLSAAKHGESGAPERVGSPVGAQEGAHRLAPAAGLRESPSGYPKHTFGKRCGPLPQRGKAVSSESDIRVPEAKRGRVPCRNEDDNRISKRNHAGQENTKEAPPPTSGDSASFVRAGSAEKLSLPRRTQPESAHARERRQPDRGWPS